MRLSWLIAVVLGSVLLLVSPAALRADDGGASSLQAHSASENPRAAADQPDTKENPDAEDEPETNSAPDAAQTSDDDKQSDSERDILVFKTGDRLSGINRDLVDGKIRWELPFGEIITVPLDLVDRVEYVRPLDELEPSPAPGKDAAAGAAEDSAASAGEFAEAFEDFARAYDDSLGVAERWAQRIEFGGAILEGNSNQKSLSTRAILEREWGLRFLQGELGGQFSRAFGKRTSNRWWGNITYDFYREGHWILFVTSKNEYDEFEHLQYRGIYSIGWGYRFINQDPRRLIVRMGPGMTYERYFEPSRVRTTPDLFAEVELRWPLTDRIQVEHKTTVNPSLDNISVFRLVSFYGLAWNLDEDKTWSLKLSFRHEHNSRPNTNREPNDYTTNVLLVYVRK